ncbi:hypothetical protein BDF14DRAFT_1739203, partial [Spinellus fusiger]
LLFIPELSRMRQLELGQMNHMCSNCGAKHWKDEISPSKLWMSCCRNGNVELRSLADPPAYLRDLYDDMSVRGRRFREQLRRYNATFAFTLIGFNAVEQIEK